MRVHACGICGSDIHQLRDGWGFTPGRVAGHEWSGTIAAVGEDVTDWSVGELVVGGPSPRCGTCRRCREGKPSQCENRAQSVNDWFDGAFAEYVVCHTGSALRLPDGLSPRHAALAEPLAVALHGITRSGVAPGQSVMVFGAGPIGALSVAALQAMGIEDITVVEPHEGRRQLVAQLGITSSSTPPTSRCSPVGAREPLVAGRGRRPRVLGPPQGHRSRLQPGGPRRHPGHGGAGIDHPTFDINRMILNEMTVTGSFVYDFDGFEHALELLASDGFPSDLLIAPEEVSLHGIVEALDLLAGGRIAGKVMVVPGQQRCRPDATSLLPGRESPLQPRGHVASGRTPRC